MDFDDVLVKLNFRNLVPASEILPYHSKGLNLSSELPVYVFYDAPVADENFERLCHHNGMLTAGPGGSDLEYLRKDQISDVEPGRRYIVETLSDEEQDTLNVIRTLSAAGCPYVLACNNSTNNLVNKFLLVGSIMPFYFSKLESIGMCQHRISMINHAIGLHVEELFSTASNSSEVCKALVAGADAVVINVGSVSNMPDVDKEMIVSAIADSVRESLSTMTKMAHCTSSELGSCYKIGRKLQ